MGQHGVEEGRAEVDAVAAQYREVILQILSHLQLGVVFVERLENVDHALCRVRFTWNGNVPGSSAGHGKAQSHEFGINCLDGGGFCVKAQGVESQ